MADLLGKSEVPDPIVHPVHLDHLIDDLSHFPQVVRGTGCYLPRGQGGQGGVEGRRERGRKVTGGHGRSDPGRGQRLEKRERERKEGMHGAGTERERGGERSQRSRRTFSKKISSDALPASVMQTMSMICSLESGWVGEGRESAVREGARPCGRRQGKKGREEEAPLPCPEKDFFWEILREAQSAGAAGYNGHLEERVGVLQVPA